jgi:hypothetical protein
MFRPGVSPRVKQQNDLLTRGVYSAQIWSLPKITPITGPAQVLRCVRSAMLLSNDVLDMMGEPAVSLVEQTVFATIAGSRANQFSRARIHYELPFVCSCRRAFN